MNSIHTTLILLFCTTGYACQDDGAESTSGRDAGARMNMADAAGSTGDQGLRLIDAGVRIIDQGMTAPMPDAGILANACLEPPMAPSQPAINLQARCRANGGALRIRDLRDQRCQDAPNFRDGDGDGFSDERVDVELPSVIVTAVFGDDFAVQDPEGGAYSGLWVFSRDRPLEADVVPGARIRLWGSMMEYYTLTEIQLHPDSGGLEVLGRGAIPEPLLVSDPSRIADGGDLTEALESILVEIQNVSVRNTAPDCPRDFDMFIVSGGLRIEDEVELNYEPSRGDFIETATGVLHFSFDHQKIRPRSNEDVVVVHCGGIPDKCEASECVAENGAEETGQVVISEIQDDPRGRDTGREFVELFNPTGSAINLTGWWLQNCADHRVDLTGRIEPNEFIVFAGSRDQDENGGIRADGELDTFQLSNGSGSLLVFNNQGQLVDQVRYDDSAPWPHRETGESLELTALGGDNSNGATWRAGRADYGSGGSGSPGRR
jgi:hypothetical protein